MEYCFLWIDWWPMCMTKAEWSGWMQVIGAFIAIMWASKIAAVTFERERQAAARDAGRKRKSEITNIAVVLEKGMEIFERVDRHCNPPMSRSEGKAYAMLQYRVGDRGPFAQADLFAVQVLIDSLRSAKAEMLHSSELSSHLINAMFALDRLRILLEKIVPAMREEEWSGLYAFGAYKTAYDALHSARNAYWDSGRDGPFKLVDIDPAAPAEPSPARDSTAAAEPDQAGPGVSAPIRGTAQ